MSCPAGMTAIVDSIILLSAMRSTTPGKFSGPRVFFAIADNGRAVGEFPRGRARGEFPTACRRSSPGWSSTGQAVEGLPPRPCCPWSGWSIAGQLVIDRARYTSRGRPCRRSSPGWSSTGQRVEGLPPRPCRPWCRSSPGWSIDRATVPVRTLPAAVRPIVAGLVIDLATCRGPSPRPCRPWCRSTGQAGQRFPRAAVPPIVAGLVIDRATCRGPTPRPCRPCCRSSPG